MIDRARRGAVVAALALAVAGPSPAAQVMDEVWFPAGVVGWGHTQMTPAILHGICDAASFLETRTPVRMPGRGPIAHSGGLDPESELGLLEVRYSEGLFNYGYGGQTKHYRKPNAGNRVLKISFQTIKSRAAARRTMTHEMMHVLGFTHEFQRWDRKTNGVRIGAARGRDPFNYGRPDRKNVRVLSPYDFESRTAANYPGVTPVHRGPPGGTLLSVHDINAIYRVYGRPLGEDVDGLGFGEAAVSADFDGDGFDDIAVAARHSDTPDNNATVFFFRGMAQAPDEDGTGTTYMPWFREEITLRPDQGHRIVLAAGDSHALADPGTAIAHGDGPDGIAELYVGLPGADRVEIWIVNAAEKYADETMPCDTVPLAVEDVSEPWGGHGVAVKLRIDAADAGAAPGSGFGAALAVGRLFGGAGDDLAIGAPEAGGAAATGRTAVRKEPRTSARLGGAAGAGGGTGPAVFLLPQGDASRAVRLADPGGDGGSEFGAALAVLPDFDKGHDTLAVGAPGARVGSLEGHGRIYVFERPVPSRSTGAVEAPALSGQYPAAGTVVRNDPDNAVRVGASLVAFRTREEDAARVHWLAWGAPEATRGEVRCGRVDLYRVRYRQDPELEHRLSPAPCEAGMGFGRALAVAQGACSDALCPRQRTWIAVGSPRQVIQGARRGAVHLWDVWSGESVNERTVQRWDGPGADSRWGSRITPVRGTQKGGGFVVAARRAAVTMAGEAAGTTRTVAPGLASVRLNREGHSRWASWTRTLTPGTGVDRAPANR